MPLNRNYYTKGVIRIDENLRNIGDDILNMMIDNNLKYASLKNNNVVEGRSWEMAAAKSMLNEKGVYSGEVIGYDAAHGPTYGKVPAIHVKRQVYKNVISVI
uniref:Uncharacterized protein n=1 Tax=viral metagenome TaxID=1070528 RepID=A0A2V0RJ69_9ZZZZ